MMDHVMTCLEDIAGISGANSLRNKYELIEIEINILFIMI
jgi:hypothetical protein